METRRSDCDVEGTRERERNKRVGCGREVPTARRKKECVSPQVLCMETWQDARRRGRRPKIVGAGSFAHFNEAQAPKIDDMIDTDSDTREYHDLL